MSHLHLFVIWTKPSWAELRSVLFAWIVLWVGPLHLSGLWLIVVNSCGHEFPFLVHHVREVTRSLSFEFRSIRGLFLVATASLILVDGLWSFSLDLAGVHELRAVDWLLCVIQLGVSVILHLRQVNHLMRFPHVVEPIFARNHRSCGLLWTSAFSKLEMGVLHLRVLGCTGPHACINPSWRTDHNCRGLVLLRVLGSLQTDSIRALLGTHSLLPNSVLTLCLDFRLLVHVFDERVAGLGPVFRGIMASC